MKPIGGFFELEVSRGKSIYHDDAVQLSTGRSCLTYILLILKPAKVYLPYYCCDALFEPMEILDIDFEFYSINQNLEIENIPALGEGEFLILCDFFGIKSEYVESVINEFQDRIIIDNTHSFFHKGYRSNYSFTSARKYFGVPDGAFLYGPEHTPPIEKIDRNKSLSISHNYHRLMGKQDLAFQEFLDHENSLGSEIKGMSLISELLLSNVDFTEVQRRRNENFTYFRDVFNSINTLDIDINVNNSFCYPLLLEKVIDKQKLFEEKIFIPNLWLDTTKRINAGNFSCENILSQELLPLPIDHRYSIEHLERVTKSIQNLISQNV